MVKVTLQKFLFWQGHVYESRLASISDSRSLRFVHLNILKNSSFIFSRSRSSLPAPPLESGCKGKACFSISKFFQAFFQTFFPAPRFYLSPPQEPGWKNVREKSFSPPPGKKGSSPPLPRDRGAIQREKQPAKR